MKILANKSEVIRFTTWDSDRNQGFIYQLGDVPVLVDTVWSTRTRRQGCSSDELIAEEMNVVTLSGRTFVVKDTSFWRTGMPKRSVALPYGFKPKEIFPTPTCPYCGK